MHQHKIRRLMVANRGEIACRIIRSAREMGIETTVIHSQCDDDSLAVRLADNAVEVGPPPASKSYLDIQAIVNAAIDHEIDAIHPGYGFLAENAKFAEAVEDAGKLFVGPDSQTIRLMGDKLAARETAKKAGVPIAEGSQSRLDSLEEMCTVAKEAGYPVLIKASAGGGGRGIRIANNQDELKRLAPQARAEAQATFGDGTLFVEKYIPQARHIEVQILGDGSEVIHCYERECSLQRRRQKVWEEAPALVLTDEIREKICASAVTLAEHVNYRGAGTVEFLYDESTEEFFFLEMNTRIQVEHPVTEMICGLDLIREMILIAQGSPLCLKQDEIRIRGHAIECRINAENPDQDFMPSPGTAESVTFPAGPGVRFDTMLFPGCNIPPYYDSMIGKLVVWDGSREAALSRLRRALSELEIEGIHTTKSLHQALVENGDVIALNIHTGFLEQWLSRRQSFHNR
ncbi:MAG: acetyl-CoA carboxylase biotin carboxylase subunit [Gammaproteobacteria bacterium]|nr:acetyl-CoA carboxylase biotin carboxylase subunit [Gammaproteobacteria bacterium]